MDLLIKIRILRGFEPKLSFELGEAAWVAFWAYAATIFNVIFLTNLAGLILPRAEWGLGWV